MLTLEEESRLVVLLSLHDLGGTATKAETLDNISKKGYIKLSNSDQKPRKNNEETWRNNLAFTRFHLVNSGYIDGSQRGRWTITANGASYLQNLASRAAIQTIWRKITPNTINSIHIKINGSNITENTTQTTTNTSPRIVTTNPPTASKNVIRQGSEEYILQSASELAQLVAAEEQRYDSQQVFESDTLLDARERAIRSIVRRRGQSAFRRQLITLYGGRCAVTSTDAEQALEAAHIIPYKGGNTNHAANGLLLRADIHTLFDLRLITIDSQTMTVLVSPELAATSYAGLAGALLQLPVNRADWPSVEALNKHRSEAGL